MANDKRKAWRAELDDPKYERVNALKPCILTAGGSNLYGLARPGSDLDVRGVFPTSLDALLGVTGQQFLIISDKDLDVDAQLNGITRTAKLLLLCNPSVIEVVLAPADAVIYSDEVGDILRSSATRFLTTTALTNAYLNYAANQMYRVRSTLAKRDKIDRVNATKVRVDDLVRKLNRETPGIVPDSFSTRVDGDKVLVSCTFTDYDYSTFASVGSSVHQIVKNMKTLKPANVNKDVYRQASHIIRLLKTGADVVAGELNFDRSKTGDADLLLSIKSGEFPLDDGKFDRLVEDLQSKFINAVDHSPWPATVDSHGLVREWARIDLELALKTR